MKFAASDFDGTLFVEHEIAKETVEAILSWRQAGHKFGGYAMASARDHIQRQAKKSFLSVGSMLREYR